MFVVQPWEGNTIDESWNQPRFVRQFGYWEGDIASQYHTHPGSTGPSNKDAIWSNENSLPVHTIGADGHVWMVDYTNYRTVPHYPLGSNKHGKIIR